MRGARLRNHLLNTIFSMMEEMVPRATEWPERFEMGVI
jgi:hypothetical protein